jgi:hypothetical protein
MSLRMTKFLDCVHRPEFFKLEDTTFRKLYLSVSSGVGGNSYSHILQSLLGIDFHGLCLSDNV